MWKYTFEAYGYSQDPVQFVYIFAVWLSSSLSAYTIIGYFG